MGRTRELLHDGRQAASNHPYLVIGLGMTLIALLTVGAMMMFARRRGIAPSELADFRRWRQRVDAEPDPSENGVHEDDEAAA